MIRKDSSTMILLSWGRDVESTASRQEKEVLRGISFKKKKITLSLSKEVDGIKRTFMFCWKFEEEFVVGTWKLRNKPTKNY